MKKQKPIITFDMDQTLIESNICHILAYEYMLKKMGLKKGKVNWLEIINKRLVMKQ